MADVSKIEALRVRLHHAQQPLEHPTMMEEYKLWKDHLESVKRVNKLQDENTEVKRIARVRAGHIRAYRSEEEGLSTRLHEAERAATGYEEKIQSLEAALRDKDTARSEEELHAARETMHSTHGVPGLTNTANTDPATKRRKVDEARSPTPVPVRTQAPRGRPRKVPGDDTNIEIILFVGEAGPTSEVYLAFSELEQSQRATLMESLNADYIATDDEVKRSTYNNAVRTSQRESSMLRNKCMNGRVYNRKMTIEEGFEKVACEYCTKLGRICARVVLDQGVYKLALFPRPLKDGITVQDARFWLS